MQKTQAQFLVGEDPLDKEMATHSSILDWEKSIHREAWGAAVHRVTESDTIGHTCKQNLVKKCKNMNLETKATVAFICNGPCGNSMENSRCSFS